jgi:DNA (cytosine-5)-methyltransferase 1
MKNITAGELFAGIGGIGLGFKKAGFKLSWANEIDKKACVTYNKNFKHIMLNKDMKELNPVKELKKVDVITGGFPCQAFSIAGYRKGFEDERGILFFDTLRFIKGINPKVIFLENVKNLSYHDEGRTLKRIKSKLKQLKYFVTSAVLNTAKYSDIPQNRERLYIVGFKDKNSFDRFKFPKEVKKTKLLSSFIEPEVSDEFYYNSSRYYPELKKKITNSNTVYQWRRMYVRENKSSLCPTLTANMGTGGHNVPIIKDKKGIRKLTPRECARLQGFPNNFILPNNLSRSALYKQIGNSVSVPVVASIAKNIKTAVTDK